MIKVTVLYPYTEGVDHAYYRDKHMPMVRPGWAVPARTTPSKKARLTARLRGDGCVHL